MGYWNSVVLWLMYWYILFDVDWYVCIFWLVGFLVDRLVLIFGFFGEISGMRGSLVCCL